MGIGKVAVVMMVMLIVIMITNTIMTGEGDGSSKSSSRLASGCRYYINFQLHIREVRPCKERE